MPLHWAELGGALGVGRVRSERRLHLLLTGKKEDAPAMGISHPSPQLLDRLNRMKKSAKNRRKYEPSIPELLAICPADFNCPECSRSMFLENRPGRRSALMTLQHDRSGAIRIICFGCNSAHNKYPGDEFYTLDKLSAVLCRRCGQTKPRNRFAKRGPFLRFPCKDCLSIENRSDYLKRKVKLKP